MLGALPVADQERVVAAMARDRAADRRRADATQPTTCCARPVPATWAGWWRAMPCSTRRSTAGATRFEGLCAEIVAQMIAATYDPARERHWIADIDGEPVGCGLRGEDHPTTWRSSACCWSSRRRAGSASGRGWSTNASASRARPAIAKMTLWTHSILVEAHHVYQGAGFERVATAPHAQFGHALVGETWERAL